MNRWKRAAGIAAIAVLHSLAAQLPAFGQDNGEAPEAIEEIVVVGTANPRHADRRAACRERR